MEIARLYFLYPFLGKRLVVYALLQLKNNSRLVEPMHKINCIPVHKRITNVIAYVEVTGI